MGRYQFVSPGAAAGAAIEDLLTKRREEARQAMLDQITAQNAEQNRKATEQNIRESAARVDSDLFRDSVGGRQVDEDMSGQPENVKRVFRDRGYLGSRPTPETGGTASFPQEDGMGDYVSLGAQVKLPEAFQADNTPVAPPEVPKSHSEYFTGTKEQNDDIRKMMLARNIRQKLQDPKTTPMERLGLVMEAEAAGINVDSGAFRAATEQPGKRYSFGQESGKTAPMLGPNGEHLTTDDQITIQTRPPQPPAPVFFTGPGGQSKWIPKGGNVPEGWRQGNQPTGGASAGVGKPIMPAGFAQKGATLKGLYESRGNDQDIANYQAWRQSAVGQIIVSDPSVRQAVQNVLNNVHPVTGEPLSNPDNDEDFGPSAIDIMGELAGQDGATPKELDEFFRAVMQIRGY